MKLTEIQIFRKNLLPIWIKFFCWIFLLFLLTPLMFLISWIWTDKIDISLFGLEYSGSPLNPIALLMSFVLFLIGVSAYGLLTGRRWAMLLSIIIGIVGLITSVIIMVLSSFKMIRLEPLLIIPFLVKMFQIRKQWLHATYGQEREPIQPKF